MTFEVKHQRISGIFNARFGNALEKIRFNAYIVEKTPIPPLDINPPIFLPLLIDMYGKSISIIIYNIAHNIENMGGNVL